MATFDFKVDTLEVSQSLAQLAAALPVAAMRTLNGIAEVTMTDAKERTPVDTGRLRSSGHVAHYATPRKLSATLAYATEYAVHVHEVPMRHKVGEWKYLEKAMNKTAGTFESDMAAALEAALSFL